jgi:hypothetical protein
VCCDHQNTCFFDDLVKPLLRLFLKVRVANGQPRILLIEAIAYQLKNKLHPFMALPSKQQNQ